MSIKQKKRIPGPVYTYIIIGVLSIFIVGLIIALEYKKDKPDMSLLWQNIVLSILCSVVASVFFSLIQNAFSDDENKALNEKLDFIEDGLKLQKDLYDSGILSIHPKSHFDKEDDFWKSLISITENKLNLIGHSLSNWFKNEYKNIFCDKILKMVEGEKEVRILLSAESFAFERVKQVYMGKANVSLLNKTEKTVLYFCELADKITESKKKYLKVYITDLKTVTYLYIRTDSQCIISPYIYSSTNSKNSFLLELKTDTKYAKTLEDDFDDMLAHLEPINLSIKPTEVMKNMEFIQYIKCDNRYSGSNWNMEKTEKFVVKKGKCKFEVGYFEHFCDDKFVKSVIELPISYGCPSKCKFCASSAIDCFYPLDADEMKSLFDYVYNLKNLYTKDYVLLTLTGTGDVFFNPGNVINFLQKLTSYKNLHITISSCLWNASLLAKVEQLSNNLKIRNIQFTYISNKEDIIKSIIPIYQQRKIDFKQIINYVKSSDKRYYRINYILIKDVNNSLEDFDNFKSNLIEIKDKIVVRISKLNETKTTKMNNLYPDEIEVMEQFKNILTEAKIKSYIFYSEKNDNLNCGQLISEQE